MVYVGLSRECIVPIERN